MKKYVAVAAFFHDGKKILPGCTISLDQRLAEYLLQGGAVKPKDDGPVVKKVNNQTPHAAKEKPC